MLAMLGVPRLMSALIQIPADRVPALLERRAPVDPQSLTRLAATRQRALAWTESGRLWVEFGVAALRLAEADRDTSGVGLRRAILALRWGLSLSPLDGAGWMWLAEAEHALNGPTRSSADAVVMSMRTAPYDKNLQLPRIAHALLVWSHLDNAARRRFSVQVRMVQRRAPKRLATLARSSANGDAIRAVLGGADKAP